MILDFVQNKTGAAGPGGAIPPIMGGAGTTTVTNIGTTTADLGGTYTSDGGSPITATGFVLYPAGNPSTIIGGSGVTNFPDGTLPSPITASATGLTAGTNYCFKPYATNAIGTSYGVEVCFTTAFLNFNKLATTNGASNSVILADKDTGVISATIPVGNNPYQLTYHLGTGKIFVPCSGSNRIDIIGPSNTVIGNIPLTGASRSYISGDILYVWGTTQLIRYDILTDTVTHTVSHPGGIGPKTWGDNGTHLYVVNEVSGNPNVYKYLKTNLTLVSTINSGFIGGGLTSVVFNTSGEFVIGAYLENTVRKFSTSDVFVNSLAIGNNTAQSARTYGDIFYLPLSSFDQVKVVNTVGSMSLITTIPVGTTPVGTYLSSDGSRLYVCNAISNNISVINTSTNAVISTFTGYNLPSYSIITY